MYQLPYLSTVNTNKYVCIYKITMQSKCVRVFLQIRLSFMLSPILVFLFQKYKKTLNFLHCAASIYIQILLHTLTYLALGIYFYIFKLIYIRHIWCVYTTVAFFSLLRNGRTDAWIAIEHVHSFYFGFGFARFIWIWICSLRLPLFLLAAVKLNEKSISVFLRVFALWFCIVFCCLFGLYKIQEA